MLAVVLPFPAVLLAQNLNSDDQDVVLRALKRVPESRLHRDGLKAMSLLLVEGNSKVVGAVSAQLRSLSENPSFRERASICCAVPKEWKVERWICHAGDVHGGLEALHFKATVTSFTCHREL